MKMGKDFKSILEVEQEYFPDSILDNLEEALCSSFNLRERYQHRLSKNQDNPRTGMLEIAKPCQVSCSVPDYVKSFYKERGFEIIEHRNERVFEVIAMREPFERYNVVISEHEETYSISILEPLDRYLKRLNEK